MLERLELRNRQVWEGHSRTLEDVTHTIGGLGLGLMLYERVRRSPRQLGYLLLGVSALLHVYAYVRKPTLARLATDVESRLRP